MIPQIFTSAVGVILILTVKFAYSRGVASFGKSGGGARYLEPSEPTDFSSAIILVPLSVLVILILITCCICIRQSYENSEQKRKRDLELQQQRRFARSASPIDASTVRQALANGLP